MRGGAQRWGQRGSWTARLAALAVFAAPFVVFWKPATGRALFAPSDALLYFFPIRQLTAKFVRDGELPLWNPFVFSGVPFLAEVQTAVLYPVNLLFLVLPPLAAMNLQMITTYSIAALTTFAYTRTVGCSVLGASLGALTYAFSGFMIAHLSHTGVIEAAAWLPALLWCLEEFRQRGGYRYIAGGALALALAVFAGHPQESFASVFVGTLYGLYFGTVGGAPVGRRRYIAAVAATIAAGLLLSAVQLVPTAELSAQTVRSSLGYEEFTLFSLPLAQVPMFVAPFLFGGSPDHPYWGSGGVGHELLGYVGLVPLMLIVCAAPLLRRDRFAWFWMGLAAFAFLMVLGPRTPVAALMFRVPLYNLFRVTSRHFLHLDLALAVLAAWSLTHIDRVAPRWARAAPLLVGGVVLSIAAVAAIAGPRLWGWLAAVTTPAGFANPVLANAFSVLSAGVGLPSLLAVLAALAISAVVRRPSTLSSAGLLAIHCVDLAIFCALVPQPWPGPHIADTVPDFVRYVSRVEPGPGDYRLALLYAGMHHPARYDFALSDVPIINGYEPLMLSRYNRFTGMTYYGTMADELVATRPDVLDLLNTRYLAIVYPGRMHDPAVVGSQFAQQPLAIDLNPGERVEFLLPAECRATAIAVASAVRGGDPGERAPVARLQAFSQDGSHVETVMQMGEHTDHWEMPAAGGRHAGSLAVFEAEADQGVRGATYRARLDWPGPLAVRRVTVESLLGSGALHLSRLSLYDASDGGSCPLTRLHTLRADAARWQLAYTNGSVELLRNLDSLPRAWLVPRTVALPAEAAVRAIQFGQLPDRSHFDPRAMALVEDEPGRDFGPLDPSADVRLTAFSANVIELRSRSSAPAFLVLSEIFYPGWEAEIDGDPAPIVRTDYVLRGVTLPAGDHRIRFVYRPRSVALGLVISLSTAVALMAIGTRRYWWSRQRQGGQQ